jgi:hypothetical protein
MDEAVEVKHLRLIPPIQPVGAENVIVETGDLDIGAI